MLYIFNIDEQLQAILNPDTSPSRSVGDTSYFLQPQYPAPDGKPATACPYWDAYHTEIMNENFQNVFTFAVPADHDDAQYVTEGNLVAFKDLDLVWQLFEIKRIVDLHGDGLTRTAYCEHALYELIDDFIEDIRPTACSATFALTQALTGTRWSVGTVADLGLNSTNYYYQSALGAVQKVASVWGGELQFRVVVTGGVISARYVDLLVRRGADTGKQFEYGRHTQEIEREVDLTTVITAAYGRGKGVEVGDGYGRRLDFGAIVWTTPTNPADKPLNQEWVGDPDALAQWGRPGGRHRFGTFEDSEETDAAALLQKTWDYLQANKAPRATYRMTVMDLERLSGYSHEKVRLGDTTRAIDRVVKSVLLMSVRVIGLTRNILRPEDTKITLGNFAPSLADEALTQRQINKVVSGAFSPTTGALATAWLDGIVNLLQNQLQATTTKFYTDANGAFVWEAIDGSSAMKIAGGIFALANAKIIDTQEWDWQTFGDGNGFTASMLNAGQIRTSLIKIFGNTEFYWDGDNLYIINPANINEQIRLSKEGIRFTRDGGQTWGVAIGFDGIKMEGKPSDPRLWYSPTGPKVYNQNGELMGHFGYYETLAALLAAFTRASTTYDDYGTLAASGVPRYPYMALPGPVWQDLFDADQLAAEYDSGGDVAATWAVSGGVLTGTGGTQATLIKKDLLLQDCDIVINSDQAPGSVVLSNGIIARYQDNNNYYVLILNDDSSFAPGSNLILYKRVAGVFTAIGPAANVTWPRGTSEAIKFTLHGSKLEAWFNGVKVISETDTTFTGGSVGLRNSSATAFRVLDFSIYYAQQGAMMEEGTANIVKTNAGADPLFNASTGWTLSNATVASGVLTLQSPDGVAAAIATCALTSLAQNTKHSFLIRARYKDTTGTANTLKMDLQGAGYDNAEQQLDILSSQLSTAFQNFKKDGFNSGLAPAATNLRVYTVSTRPIEVEFVQLEQKDYATSIMDGTRAAEAMTVPTAGVFTKGNWAIKLEYTPKVSPTVAAYKTLWHLPIDGNNYYVLAIEASTGRVYLQVYSGGIGYTVIGGSALQTDQGYSVMISGNGSTMRLCVNGVQIGTDTVYVEPVGALPTNMYVGCNSGSALQANGILSGFAVLNQPETLADHQADYNSGLPLSVDDATTYLMSCTGNLQPTVRGFGLWSKNGRFILQDPLAGQGIEVWDGATRKVLIGRLDDGTIGQEIVGGALYSSLFRTGAKTDTAYIELVPPNIFRIVYNSLPAVEIVSGGPDGTVSLYDAGTEYARFASNYSISGTVHSAVYTLNGRPLAILGPNNKIRFNANGSIDYMAGAGANTFYGDLNMNPGSTKNNTEETVNYGKRKLVVRESPEQKYIDEGKVQLESGVCTITLDPILIECIEPNTEGTPWLIHLTTYADVSVYVAEIGNNYFIVKERSEGTSNSVFVWSLSAFRKNFAYERFPEVV